MSTSIEVLQRRLSQQEIADRLRAYHYCMEPHNKAAARALSMLMPTRYLMSNGALPYAVYCPEDQALIDEVTARLQEVSNAILKSLGLTAEIGRQMP